MLKNKIFVLSGPFVKNTSKLTTYSLQVTLVNEQNNASILH